MIHHLSVGLENWNEFCRYGRDQESEKGYESDTSDTSVKTVKSAHENGEWFCHLSNLTSVADPDPHVLCLPDPDLSLIMQKIVRKTLIPTIL
jgi:hypothetical protein